MQAVPIIVQRERIVLNLSVQLSTRTNTSVHTQNFKRIQGTRPATCAHSSTNSIVLAVFPKSCPDESNGCKKPHVITLLPQTYTHTIKCQVVSLLSSDQRFGTRQCRTSCSGENSPDLFHQPIGLQQSQLVEMTPTHLYDVKFRS